MIIHIEGEKKQMMNISIIRILCVSYAID